MTFTWTNTPMIKKVKIKENFFFEWVMENFVQWIYYFKIEKMQAPLYNFFFLNFFFIGVIVAKKKR